MMMILGSKHTGPGLCKGQKEGQSGWGTWRQVEIQGDHGGGKDWRAGEMQQWVWRGKESWS